MSMKKSIFFITGASGFIGRRLCAKLLKQGHEVRVLLRSVNDPYLKALGSVPVHGNLHDPQSYSQALVGCDVVFHLGGDASFGSGKHYMHINYKATRKLLEALRENSPGLRRFVFVSTFGAVDRAPDDQCKKFVDESFPAHPSSDYGKSKLAAEKAVRESSLPWCIIRPTPVVGAEMRANSHMAVFVQSALTGSALSRFGFPGRMSFIHRDDLVEALIMAAENPKMENRTFFAAGEAIRLGQIFQWVAPENLRLSLNGISSLLKPFISILPFTIKSLLYDGLTASDSSLRELGWSTHYNGRECVQEVIQAVRRREDIYYEIQGYTLVTGAASGLGKALAEKLDQMGRNLILVDKNAENLNQILPEKKEVRRVVCDLADDKEVQRLLEFSEWIKPGINEVFACAGFGARGSVTRLDGMLQADIFKVNIISRVRLCQHAANLMSKRHWGRIVLISSSSAYQPLPFMAAYAASNAALLSFGEALWGELEESGVDVLTVCPGGMSTNFQENAGVLVLPNEKLDTPEEVAEEIIMALSKRKKNALAVGRRSKGMDLVARLLPRVPRVRLWRKLMSSLR